MASPLTQFLTTLEEQRSRWIFWLPVPMGAGIAAYFNLTTEPPVYLGAAGLAGFVVLSGAFYRSRILFPLWLALLMILIGFTAAQVRTWSVETPMLHKKTYPVTVSGRVIDIDPLPKANRIVLDHIDVVDGKIWQRPLPDKVRIKLKGNDPTIPAAGDMMKVKGILQPISPPVMPGAFDFQRYAFFEQLGATGYAIGDLEITQKRDDGFFFEKLRRIIRARIYAAASDPDHAALLTAFMVGESRSIPERVWDTARKSGIAHLIAISGSHFVMIAGFPFFLIRALLAAIPFIALRWPIKKIAAVGAILASIFYMLLIDSPIPAQRAVISVCVVMVAIMFDRDPFTQRLAAFSALVIMLLEPESLMGPSFQLSFAAIVALIAFYESTRDYWHRQFKDPNFFRRICFMLIGCFMTTLVASSATAPFSLYHFSAIPFIAGLAANMIAVPVSSFITFPAGLLGCLLMPLGLEKPLLVISEKSLDLIMTMAETVTHWSFGSFHGGGWPGAFLAAVALGGLWICFWQGRIRWLGVAPIVIVMILIPFIPRPDVLVSDNGRLYAVRTADGGLWLSSRRIERFVAGEWQKREGAAGEDISSPLTCDDTACIYAAKNRKVSFVNDASALDADCETSDVIVTERSSLSCASGKAIVINRETLRAQGAQAIYLETPVRIETVNGQRGRRPWTN